MGNPQLKRPDNAKERNLVKGAIRRVFSRSDLRKVALDANAVDYKDPARPRVTAFVYCSVCGLIFPRYLADVDHVLPIVPVDKSLEEMSWTELVDRVWCDLDNLQILDEDCHSQKSKLENQERRRLKKERGLK